MKRKTIDELLAEILHEEDSKEETINNEIHKEADKTKHLTVDDIWTKLGGKPPVYEDEGDETKEEIKEANQKDIVKPGYYMALLERKLGYNSKKLDVKYIEEVEHENKKKIHYSELMKKL